MKKTEIASLYDFMIVAEEENISRAAKRLLVSQPALSASVSRLERSVGLKLLNRTGNKVTLTEAGHCLYQHLNSAFSIIDEGLAQSRKIADQQGDAVRVVSSMGILRSFCQRACTSEHGVRIELTVCDTEDIVRQITGGKADIGISFGRIEDSRLVCDPLMEGPLCVAVNKEHPLFEACSVTMRELSEYQLFCSNLAHTCEWIGSLFRKSRCTCKLLTLDEKDVLFNAVKLGVGGVVCLPMLAEVMDEQGTRDRHDIRFIPITDCPEQAGAFLVYSRGLYRTAEINAAADHIRHCFDRNAHALNEELQDRGITNNHASGI